jgi:hypothetical protein
MMRRGELGDEMRVVRVRRSSGTETRRQDKKQQLFHLFSQQQAYCSRINNSASNGVKGMAGQAVRGEAALASLLSRKPRNEGMLRSEGVVLRQRVED